MSYRGFPASLVSSIVCQKCFGALEVDTDSLLIKSGRLLCGRCGNIHKIEEGILHLLEVDKLDSFRKSEIESRDKNAQEYDARLSVRHEKEVVSTLRAIGNVKGKQIIEYGAGTGRLTKEYVSRAKGVIASDFSLHSLEILAKNLPSDANVGLACADATSLRVNPEAFDVAIATQFYEHLPTKELREKFLSGCFDALCSGGRFVSTTYHYDLRMRMKKKPQEGMHPTGIFFHYYTKDELKTDFSQYFQIETIRLIDITLPLEARVHLPARIGGWISRICERIPVVSDLGHLLLLIAVRK